MAYGVRGAARREAWKRASTKIMFGSLAVFLVGVGVLATNNRPPAAHRSGTSVIGTTHPRHAREPAQDASERAAAAEARNTIQADSGGRSPFIVGGVTPYTPAPVATSPHSVAMPAAVAPGAPAPVVEAPAPGAYSVPAVAAPGPAPSVARAALPTSAPVPAVQSVATPDNTGGVESTITGTARNSASGETRGVDANGTVR